MARISKSDLTDITSLARKRNLDPAAVLAVVHVESGGMTGSMVNGKLEPIIRFEGHYFDKRLTRTQRARARAEGLSSPKAGGVANPSTQRARYALVDHASAINRQAALESVSWGVGQVMGAHWKHLGYRSVEALVQTARSGVTGQVSLMLDFIERNGLRDALEQRDWATFARRYNGPGYAKNRYDEKIAKAWESYRAEVEPSDLAIPSPSVALLRRGNRGTAVARLQRSLSRIGFETAADGIFGPLTERAVCDFQRTRNLQVDGIYGSDTADALQAAIGAKSRKRSDVHIGRLLASLWTLARLVWKRRRE